MSSWVEQSPECSCVSINIAQCRLWSCDCDIYVVHLDNMSAKVKVAVRVRPMNKRGEYKGVWCEAGVVCVVRQEWCVL